MDAGEILSVLPHRYPFLLVDRILEYEPGRRAIGLKNVSLNEPFFQGHYPGRPIMPGVLILEAMAQVAGIAVLTSAEAAAVAAAAAPGGSMVDGAEALARIVPLVAGFDEVRFRKPVVPGDQLRIEAQVVRLRGKVGKIQAKAFVDGETVAEAALIFALGSE